MAEAGDTRAGIGTRLRAAREKKGFTLLQAAERLHLDSRILEWLEAENFAALGAPVYARGHLRHYAELVDESPAQLQELYAEATRSTPAQPDLTKIARAEPESDAGRFAVPAMVGLVAVAIIGTVWWFIQTGEHGHPVDCPDSTPDSLDDPTRRRGRVEAGRSRRWCSRRTGACSGSAGHGQHQADRHRVPARPRRTHW